MKVFLLAFIPLFVAVDPIGLTSIFVGMTRDSVPERRSRLAGQATFTAALVAVGFVFLGKFIFQALGITVADFQVAGGLILLVLEHIQRHQIVADTFFVGLHRHRNKKFLICNVPSL